MRYLPHTKEDIDSMLAVTGHVLVDDLFESIPEDKDNA
jgi:glycine dehydrogenase subunit 1